MILSDCGSLRVPLVLLGFIKFAVQNIAPGTIV